jgi:glucose-6-phosphate 1-dehydrogenase
MVLFGASGDLTSRLLMPAIAPQSDPAHSAAQPVIFRIDHFLSDELVRRVLALRFVNRIFEQIWNAVHVDHVEISWLESLTLEGRASYYDRAGALKDMV